MTTLSLWTVYTDPTDYPGEIVARRYEINRGVARATEDVIVTKTLGTMRSILEGRMHLSCLTRRRAIRRSWKKPVVIVTAAADNLQHVPEAPREADGK